MISERIAISRWKDGEITLVSASSTARVKRFVDEFIRSEFVSNWTSDNDTDFINEPERASRCYDAAEFGAHGATHSEIIEDWRDAFKAWIRDNHRRHNEGLFCDAVDAYFDSVEAWHEKNGSLNEEIG